MTNTLTGEWRGNNKNGLAGDDDYGVLVDRLNVTGSSGGLAAAARVDGEVLIDPPSEAYEDDLRLERINVLWHSGDLEVEAGDYYRQLGRGIALSIRKLDEVGLDLAIRGGRLSYRFGEQQVGAFAGLVNPANLDSVSEKHLDDTNDVLAGWTFESSSFAPVTLGAFGVFAQPRERLLPEERDWSSTLGVSIDAPEVTEWLTVYAEADVQHRELAGVVDHGYALYATGDLVFSDYTLLVEGMLLHGFEQNGSRNDALGTRFAYNQPPTLERIDQEVANNRDVAGGHLRAERSFWEGDLIVYASGMVRVNDAGEPNALLQIHGYAGIDMAFDERASRLRISGGYRDESQPEQHVKSMAHFEADLVKGFEGGTALHLSSTNEIRTQSDRTYGRGSTFAGAELSGFGGLTMEVGYDTQDPSPGVRQVFVAGILFLELGSAAQLRATAGTQRGGIKCVAGVCRDFPEFAGARAELVVRL